MTFRAAGMRTLAFDPHHGVINTDVVLALYLQGLRIAADINGIAATALRLAANRAIATLIGVRRCAVQRKVYGAAVAGTFEFHRAS